MPGTTRHLFSVLICLFIISGCHTTAPAPSLVHYEVVPAGQITDSLSVYLPSYKEDLKHWKTVYADCLHDSVFPEAFYLGLQNNLGIGGISNKYVRNINRQLTVLDTSANGNLFDILSINKSGNCFSKINLNTSLQNEFYKDLVGILKASTEYSYLADAMDSSQIVFHIPTLIDYSIRPDTLVSRLARTTDSSLIKFRDILTSPGNALLIRAGMIFGYDCDFHLKRNMTTEEMKRFQNEVSFSFGPNGQKGSIKGLSASRLRMNIVQNYTVFGQFYVFR